MILNKIEVKLEMLHLLSNQTLVNFVSDIVTMVGYTNNSLQAGSINDLVEFSIQIFNQLLCTTMYLHSWKVPEHLHRTACSQAQDK